LVVSLIFQFGIWLSVCGVSTDTIQVKHLNEVVVCADKIPVSLNKTARQIEHFDAKNISFGNNSSLSEVLSNSGLVQVQKSQQGGGSPVIRGFEASRVLLVVDGIRLNNLIYRSGHLQNLITVDDNNLNCAEVLFGSASVMYGSDALGGTVYLKTSDPVLFFDKGRLLSGNASYLYNAANSSSRYHTDLNVANGAWAGLSSFSYSSFDDLRMGAKRNGNLPFFGARNIYALREGNNDRIVRNPDTLLQRFSGYTQFDIMQKVLYQPSKRIRHLLNFQYSGSSDIPRYDRLTDAKEGKLTNAEWYYGPQKRLLAAYHLNFSKLFLKQDLSAIVHYQNVAESRHQRKFGNDWRQNRTEIVNMYGTNLNLSGVNGHISYNYGLELSYQTLKSSAKKLNITNGSTAKLDTRYPNGENSMWFSDFYFNSITVLSSRVVLNSGIRVGYSSLESMHNDTVLFRLPFSKISQDNFTWSGSAGIVFNMSEFNRISGSISTGYRVPNVDDLSKIFESTPGNLIVPNENLKPEKTISSELGVVLGSQGGIRFKANFYYTRFFNAIVVAPYQFQGKDSIFYNQVMSRIIANQNQNTANIFGFSTNLSIPLWKYFSVNGTCSYTRGRVVSSIPSYPLDHISPFFGRIALQFKKKNATIESYVLFNGKKNEKDYAPNGEDNLAYAPPGGTPSWHTFNFKASCNLNKSIVIQAGCENIFDIQYRVFASGINASGRSFWVSSKVLSE